MSVVVVIPVKDNDEPSGRIEFLEGSATQGTMFVLFASRLLSIESATLLFQRSEKWNIIIFIRLYQSESCE